jgi:hypothetical protein
MNKLELLLSAAKAISLKHVDYSQVDYDGSYGLMVVDEHGRTMFLWNPLENDSDAFKLAVKLRITVSFTDCECCATVFHRLVEDEISVRFSNTFSDNETSCAYAAARLAIVRMAAEIGKVVV